MPRSKSLKSHAACLRRWWRSREVMQRPVCKRVSGRKRPPRNLALKNLCEAFLLEQEQRAEDVCSLHSENLKLFCLEHQEPICLVCRDSERHAEHKFRPIDEAARGRREELDASLKPLEDRLKLFKEVQEDYERTGNHIKIQAQQVKKQIRREAKLLRELLEAEAAVRVAAVRAEQKEKCELVKKRAKDLRKRITSLSDTITKARQELRAGDVSFLRRYGAAAERVGQQPLWNDPVPPSGSHIDTAKHVGNLTFNIWSKMRDLYFDSGSKHDSPGVHSWEVKLGEGQHWMLGVEPESVKSKGLLGSQSGLWSLAFHEGTYKASTPSQPVCGPALEKRLQRIRVHLNCDAVVLRFSDPDMLIQSFRCRSTEPLFPFLGTTDT
ncbi:E3 ubiquitin-protein ligase TRIM35-like [Fundulus diaphanus]